MNVQNPITKVRLRAAARADKSFGAALADAAPCHADAQASGATRSRNRIMRRPGFEIRRPHSGNDGFTMVELLVVVTIIIVLAAVVFATFRRVTASAHRATCMGIMRQYAVAVNGYLADHQNRMPNIQSNWQTPNYSSQGGNQIYGHILPYLGLETQPKLTALPENLVCPAWRKRFSRWNSNGAGSGAGSVYWVNQDQSIGGRRIFGSQGVDPSSPDFYGGMDYSKISVGTANTRVSNIPFLADGQGFNEPKETTDPVHGEMRNCLYFDFHVESRPAKEVKLTISP
jgi:prepilin-type N-terminal cleavage/methylation domain-containing protein/prepilin-type processing-associated H-X9-DG protein